MIMINRKTLELKSERDEPAVAENDDFQERSSTGRHRSDRRKS